MAGTTYSAIRDNYITAIEALTPTKHPAKKFRRMNRKVMQETHADENKTAGILRCFEIRQVEGGTEHEPQDPDRYQVTSEFELGVLYPTLPQLYGADGYDDMEEVIEQDGDQLRDTITKASNYVATYHYVSRVMSRRLEQEEDLWILVLTVEIIYDKDQTL